MAKKTIFVIDDDPMITILLEHILSREGYEIAKASDGREAVDMGQAMKVAPDLVISDIMMPQVSGYEFLKQMREDVRFLNLPVVFLTAKGMTKDRIEGYNAGCDAYLSKPFDPDELVAIAENLIARRAMQSVTANSNTSEMNDLAGQLAEIKALLKQKPAINVTPPPIKIEFTPREQSVLELVVEGLMNKEIAKRLGTTIRNVEKYVSRLFSKTGTSSRTELVRYALQHGLIDAYS